MPQISQIPAEGYATSHEKYWFRLSIFNCQNWGGTYRTSDYLKTEQKISKKERAPLQDRGIHERVTQGTGWAAFCEVPSS